MTAFNQQNGALVDNDALARRLAVLEALGPFDYLGSFTWTNLGAQTRALGIAVGLDEAGNALFGGNARQTISCRTGKALVRGARWARIVGPAIDLFFGAGHCLSHANDAP